MPGPSDLLTLAFALVCLVFAAACSDSFEDDDADERAPMSMDLRDHARDARANLVHLPADRRAVLEPLVTDLEAAIRHHDQLMEMGKTRRAATGMLYGAGTFVVANDVTGVGIADDVALPFLALGVLVVHLATESSASSGDLGRARSRVLDASRNVSEAFSRMEELDEPITPPGTRQHCIDTYVDCQLNGRRGFSRGGCQRCMDWCMGQEFKWPETSSCDYK